MDRISQFYVNYCGVIKQGITRINLPSRPNLNTKCLRKSTVVVTMNDNSSYDNVLNQRQSVSHSLKLWTLGAIIWWSGSPEMLFREPKGLDGDVEDEVTFMGTFKCLVGVIKSLPVQLEWSFWIHSISKFNVYRFLSSIARCQGLANILGVIGRFLITFSLLQINLV